MFAAPIDRDGRTGVFEAAAEPVAAASDWIRQRRGGGGRWCVQSGIDLV